MSLRWLDFDYSEGDDDTGVFDAMASVELGHAAEVQAEIDAVLAWAEATFPGCRGPVEDGGEWDAELQVSNEDTNPPRRCFSLAIGGTRAFCQALGERFG
ncbi:hypothetical protein C7T35_28895 [Variovorax sp. WS11]|uniref:hypothetical protein n=1 Tax=Variovorax sp. WS11 TaxID=1105204 RepID=UPI000D0DE713|nr:hypothetical protein [Variovorax sp. WS11]NDZ17256.1 hypothetical protein [Variovorax sp. WS11]PSL81070.1 hypothetical protein C7T35_28895 [Variovorax sp. WS11]